MSTGDPLLDRLQQHRAQQNREKFGAAQRQVVRPSSVVIGGTAKFYKPNDWRVVTQAAPSTVPPSQPALVQAFSNAHDSYDSTTLGKKTIISFANAISVASGQSLIINIFSEFGANRWTRLDMNNTVAKSYTASITLRGRPITAAFDVTTVTWDNTVTAPTLTYGSANEPAAASTNSNSDTAINFNAGDLVRMIFTGALTVYGFIIDVKAGDIGGAPNLTTTADWSKTVTSTRTLAALVYTTSF